MLTFELMTNCLEARDDQSRVIGTIVYLPSLHQWKIDTEPMYWRSEFPMTWHSTGAAMAALNALYLHAHH